MITAIFIFVFGLIVGSFLNVLIYRLNVENVPAFWQGRSFCPSCRHTLRWLDNVPLLSYFFLGGCCRFCRKKISWQYPVVEAVTGLVSVMVVSHMSQSPIWQTALVLTIIYCLIVIFFSDVFYFLIPDEMVLLGSVLASILVFDVNLFKEFTFSKLFNSNFFNHLVSGIGASLSLYLIYFVTRGKGIGFGDVKLAVLLGLILGFPMIVVGFWFSFVLGGIVSVGLIIFRRKGVKDVVPFGPFLIFGTVLAALFSSYILGMLV